jgi:hypothetical protein
VGARRQVGVDADLNGSQEVTVGTSVLFPPVELHILVVTDGMMGFGSNYLGLQQLLRVVTQPSGVSRVTVTKGHREITDQTIRFDEDYDEAQIQDFRFDGSVRGYDEVWLFGFSNTEPTLGDRELGALAQFMERGGGLFATGDHEDLGRPLAGRLPRVRSMRRWAYPPAPSVAGDDRHQTTIATARRGSEETDLVPKTIRPVLQRLFVLDQATVTWPHPLLCGRDGVLTALPDHMHEGDCVVPMEFRDDAQEFGQVEGRRPSVYVTYRTVEYPRSADGQRVTPEIVAHAELTAPGHEGQTFGAIGAYDGHRAGVGRVAVDSTFHHFTNGNVYQFLRPDDLFRTPEEESELRRVKRCLEDYYRNLVFWLAPPEKLSAMAGHYVWQAVYGQVLAEEVPRYGAAATQPWEVGARARTVLGRATTRCQEMAILGTLLPLMAGGKPMIGPSPSSSKESSEPKGPRLLDPDFLLDAALGGAMLSVVEHLPTPPGKPPVDVDAEDYAALIATGSRQGLKAAVMALRKSAKHLEKQTDEVEAALGAGDDETGATRRDTM